MNSSYKLPDPQRQISENLVLRQGKAEDIERIALFNATQLSDNGPDNPFMPLAHWTRDLMNNQHPSTTPEHFTYVEDTRTGEIVSCLCTIPQTWTYAGVPFQVGRPELVSTHPDYRRKGLVRAQFDVLHEWGRLNGELMQVITGIPFYYRQFGYEMALDLGGGRTAYRANIPKLAEGQAEPYLMREAVQSDLPFILEAYGQTVNRSLVAQPFDEGKMRYALFERSPESIHYRKAKIITNAEGEQVGYFVHSPVMWYPILHVWQYEIIHGQSWTAITPSVLRYLQKIGEGFADHQAFAFEGVYFDLGFPGDKDAPAGHPLFNLYANQFPRVIKPYAFYVRIPDQPAFTWEIRSVLEERLARSPLEGYTGTLEISFYRSGLRLVFEKGKVIKSEAWQPTTEVRGQVRFPGLSFLSLICGQKSFQELDGFYPDCSADNDEIAQLTSTLFPKHFSHVWDLS